MSFFNRTEGKICKEKTLHKQYKKLGISAVRRIGFSFFAVILIGSILLSLPMSHTIHSTSSYLDHLLLQLQQPV